MGNEPNKQHGQQGQQGQSQSSQPGQQSSQPGQQSRQQTQPSHQQGQQDPAGSVNTTDKWKSNQPQTGSNDPKNTQDMSKKDPSK